MELEKPNDRLGGAILSEPNDYQYDNDSFMGGALIDDDISHQELYHHLLQMTPYEWEATRESAHQMLGGSASNMWTDERGGAITIGGAYAMGGAMTIGGGHSPFHLDDLKDIVLTPTSQAAARMVELEHNAKGSGFKSGVIKALRGAKHIYDKGKSAFSKGSKIYKGAVNVARKARPILDIAEELPVVGEVARGAKNLVVDPLLALDSRRKAMQQKIQPTLDKLKPVANQIGNEVNKITASNEDKPEAKTEAAPDINAAQGSGLDKKMFMHMDPEMEDDIDEQIQKNKKKKRSKKHYGDQSKSDEEEKGAGINSALKNAGEHIQKVAKGGSRKKKKKVKFTYGGMKEDVPKEPPSTGGAYAMGGSNNSKCVDPRKRF